MQDLWPKRSSLSVSSHVQLNTVKNQQERREIANISIFL